MLDVVQNSLMSYHHFLVSTELVSCIRIAVPAREVATGDIQANAMPLLEKIARCPQVYFVLVGFSWLDERRLLAVSKVAVASTNDAIGEILCIAIRVYIHQANHEIGIWGT